MTFKLGAWEKHARLATGDARQVVNEIHTLGSWLTNCLRVVHTPLSLGLGN